jgi:hypothetical protein
MERVAGDDAELRELWEDADEQSWAHVLDNRRGRSPLARSVAADRRSHTGV